ncbi:hypothetical protein MAR_015484 [Mya arenaria]|uniref:Transmembrane protein n=1 Tax=Mya arenaria TaxID=6604 RepID=A0ABY7FHF7_MYAAR|nr:hypothetical protein MAR_015484 [Mya arenaria]
MAIPYCVVPICVPGFATLIILLVLGLTGLGVAKIVMGAVYLDECEYEPLVPIYVLVSGCSGFFTVLLGRLKPNKDIQRSKQSKSSLDKFLVFLGGLAAVFSFVWLICGSVWVFGNYSDVMNGCPGSPNCCEKSIIKFAMTVTIIDLIVYGLILFVLVCICVSVICQAVKVKDSAPGVEAGIAGSLKQNMKHNQRQLRAKMTTMGKENKGVTPEPGKTEVRPTGRDVYGVMTPVSGTGNAAFVISNGH